MLSVEQAQSTFKELKQKIIGLKKKKDYDKKEIMRMQCKMAYLRKRYGVEDENKIQDNKELHKQVSSNNYSLNQPLQPFH